MSGKADERARISARIRALLSKTVQNGCTEGEALAAAAKVAELLAQYDLSMDEVDLRAEPFSRDDRCYEDDVGDRLGKPATSISKLTGTRWWRSARGVAPASYTFFGLEHGVEIAGYLLAICARAMQDEANALDAAGSLYRPDVRRRRRMAFLDGMAETLARRILAMVPGETSTGRGIVPLRFALIDAEMARIGIELGSGRGRKPRDFDPDYSKGRAAGEAVALNPGLGGGSPEHVRIGRPDA